MVRKLHTEHLKRWHIYCNRSKREKYLDKLRDLAESNFNGSIIKAIIYRNREVVRRIDRKWFQWIGGTEIHHQWKKSKSSNYYFALITEKRIHQGIIHKQFTNDLHFPMREMFCMSPIHIIGKHDVVIHNT
ncbi:hypothetical protein KAX02_08050 [candidate division WOR-3 bacterium]|nr:hypothetical protein [candidate division WOR-3 bacterium]